MAEKIDREWIVENKWKCRSCGNENPGHELKCSNCGAPKEKGTQDIVADGNSAAEITDAQKIAEANAGENWVCAYCGSHDRESDGKCKNCGADKADAKRPQPSTPVPQPPAKKSGMPGWVWAIGGVVVAIALLLWWLFHTREVGALVVATPWQTDITLQQRNAHSGESWRDEMKGEDQSDVRCASRQRGTRNCEPYQCNPHDEKYDCGAGHKCNCHRVTKDLKNGYSKVQEVCDTCFDQCTKKVYDTCYHQCPVYADWCSYQYHSWDDVKTEHAAGDDSNPQYAALAPVGADQRVSKAQKYEVQLGDGKHSWKYEPKDLADFQRFHKGARWVVGINSVGKVQPEREAK